MARGLLERSPGAEVAVGVPVGWPEGLPHEDLIDFTRLATDVVEQLLGKGDMLFLPPASSQVVRVHGAFVDEKEIGRIVDHIKAQGKPEYDTSITKSDEELDESGDLPGKRDPLFWDALKCVVNAKRGSTSLLQRHLRIGYGRAAAILDAGCGTGLGVRLRT